LKRLLAIDPADRPGASDILQAIRTEKGLDAPSRAKNGVNSGIGGRIIQSVDSPMPPGTPVNEPSKPSRSGAYLEDAISSSSDSPSPSPEPESQLILESNNHQSNNTRKIVPSITTPLLMAPPSTIMSTIKHQMTVYHHYLVSWATLNQQTLLLIAKLGIFLAKMLSITRPCLPVAVRQGIWYPLVILAGFELALGTKVRWRFVGLLATIHFGVVLWAVKLGGGLCERRRLNGEWGLGVE